MVFCVLVCTQRPARICEFCEELQDRPRLCARRFLETGAWRTVATVQSADMSAHSKEDVARLAGRFLVCLLLHVVDGQQTSRVLGIAWLAGPALERPGKSPLFSP